jgi:TQXA domain-containing protein/LPXTG-motif cell wall-anchored protein
VIALVGATPALAADPVVAQPRGGQAYGSVKLEGIRGSVGIGPMWLDFGHGEKALAYCIDLHHPVALNRDYAEGSWSESEVRNLAKVQWVLLHGHPTVAARDLFTAAGASLDGIRPDRVEAVVYSATQVAVWHFSDGADLVGNGNFRPTEYAAVASISAYLTGHATDQPEPAAKLSISPAAVADVKQGGRAGPFTVTGPSGDIPLTVTGGTAVDADGKAVTSVVNGGRFYLTRDTPGEVTVSAKAEATHSTGRVFLFCGGNQARQKLILAGTAGEELTAGAKAAFTPVPASTPSASPSVPAASGGGGGELARTGTSLVGPVVGGVLLLAAGLGALLVVRRRRVRFTA